MNRRVLPLLFVTLLLAQGCSLAHHAVDRIAHQNENATPGWTASQFQEENDVFAFTDPSDRAYTQGLRLTSVRNPNDNPHVVESFSNWFTGRFAKQLPQPVTLWSLGVGQSIYTPQSIKIGTPQIHDRPWAGWFYLDSIVQIADGSQAARQQHLFELQAGVVGPYSGAYFGQAALHKLIGSPNPRGWKNQIHNEAGVNGTYRYFRRWGNRTADLTWHGGGAAGTVMDYLNTGFTVRVGHNMRAFPIGTPVMANTAGGDFSGTRKPFEIALFGGVDGRYVLHNIFLTGGTFQEAPHELDIEPKRPVYDLIGGASVRVHTIRLTYSLVKRSREFDDPLAIRNFPHKYGAIVIAYEPIIRVH